MLRKNVAGQKVRFSLFKSGAIIANATMAAGDFRIAIGDAAQTNVATLPTSDAAGLVTWLPSQAETNADYIVFLANDVAGAEWEPLTIEFDTRIATIVWGDATTRTLTSTAAATTSAVSGSDLTVTAAVSFDATLSSLTIPATWTACIFTAKGSESDADSASWVQIRESNPGVGTDGLLYVNGAAGTAAQAYLTVDQSGGTIVIHIADNATALFTRALTGGYDIKALQSDGESTLLTSGTFYVQLTETKAIV